MIQSDFKPSDLSLSRRHKSVKTYGMFLKKTVEPSFGITKIWPASSKPLHTF